MTKPRYPAGKFQTAYERRKQRRHDLENFLFLAGVATVSAVLTLTVVNFF